MISTKDRLIDDLQALADQISSIQTILDQMLNQIDVTGITVNMEIPENLKPLPEAKKEIGELIATMLLEERINKIEAWIGSHD